MPMLGGFGVLDLRSFLNDLDPNELTYSSTGRSSTLHRHTHIPHTPHRTRLLTRVRAAEEPVLVMLVAEMAEREAQKAQTGWIFYRGRRLTWAWAPPLLHLVLVVVD